MLLAMYYVGLTVCVCRDLRRQFRIQIHLQFFASLLLSSVVSLMWYMLVHYELLTNDVLANTVIARDQVKQNYPCYRMLAFPVLYPEIVFHKNFGEFHCTSNWRSMPKS